MLFETVTQNHIQGDGVKGSEVGGKEKRYSHGAQPLVGCESDLVMLLIYERKKL